MIDPMLPPKVKEYNSRNQLAAVDCFYSAAEPRSLGALRPNSALARLILETRCADLQATSL